MKINIVKEIQIIRAEKSADTLNNIIGGEKLTLLEAITPSWQ